MVPMQARRDARVVKYILAPHNRDEGGYSRESGFSMYRTGSFLQLGIILPRKA